MLLRPTLSLSLALILCANMASALSCLRPDAARSYERASASDKLYVVADGKFHYDPAELTKPNIKSFDGQRIERRFRGKRLTKTGFNAPFDETVTILVHCIGPWCGGVALDERQTVFLHKQGSTYVFDAEPCSAWSFLASDKSARATIENCQSQGGCGNSAGK